MDVTQKEKGLQELLEGGNRGVETGMGRAAWGAVWHSLRYRAWSLFSPPPLLFVPPSSYRAS